MPRTARVQGYSRRHRFAARGSFGGVLRGARKLKGRLVVLHMLPMATRYPRLGIALTRRLVPTAVQRNHVKRIAREAFRRHECKSAGFDLVLTLREKLRAEDRDALATEIVALLDRAAAPDRS
jgi:ribonuclease P protein component